LDESGRVEIGGGSVADVALGAAGTVFAVNNGRVSVSGMKGKMLGKPEIVP
jgi:hypothetical protein